MQRRDFFNSFKKHFNKPKHEPLVLRPPYYEDISLFEQNCINCDGKCANSCEENIIVINNKLPELNFKQSGCTYCDECAKACDHEVLKIENKKNIEAKFNINPAKCLSWQKTMCFACKDPCLDNAIEFAGIYFPEIITNKCTSCGFCISVCPTDAIELEIEAKS